MKSARGSRNWKKVGNVRRRATDGELLLWDSRRRGTYEKAKHGILSHRIWK